MYKKDKIYIITDKINMAFVKLILIFILCVFNQKILCIELSSPNGIKDRLSIIGGHKVTIEEAPYMLSLRLNGTYHWCGGSIISPRFVLTAAHCIVPNREYKVLVGTNEANNGGDLYDVEKIIIHNKYSQATGEYDASILKLSNDLILSDKVATIKLADKKDKIKAGTMLKITGWGNIDEKGPMSKDLLQVSVPLVGHNSCRISYLKALRLITNKMICAGEKGRDACQGDSGGPLMYEGTQVGISSFGAGCGMAGMPGVYTKVSAIHDWIKQHITV